MKIDNTAMQIATDWATIDFHRCLAQLRGRQAEVFMLREIDGLSTEEICKELNITATNSWVMLYRARMGLRRCREDNWIDDSN